MTILWLNVQPRIEPGDEAGALSNAAGILRRAPDGGATLPHPPRVPLGVGIYSRAEAARLLRLTPQRLGRWVLGYTYWLKAGTPRRTHKPPVVHTDLPMIDGTVALSFLELMELRVVKAFVGKGVPLQRVRVAAQRIADLFQTTHPFAHQRVYTDREQIYVALSDVGIEPDLLQVTGQHASSQLIAGGIFDRYLEETDFEETTALAGRWFPLGRQVPIVLDPHIAFGAPVIAGTGIRTDVLSLYAAGNPPPAVARAFELELPRVQAAIDFETQLARAA